MNVITHRVTILFLLLMYAIFAYSQDEKYEKYKEGKYKEYLIKKDTNFIEVQLETELGKANLVNWKNSLFEDSKPLLDFFDFKVDITNKRFSLLFNLSEVEEEYAFHQLFLDKINFKVPALVLDTAQLNIHGNFLIPNVPNHVLPTLPKASNNKIIWDFESNDVEQYTGSLSFSLITELYGAIDKKHAVACNKPCPSFERWPYYTGIAVSSITLGFSLYYHLEKQNIYATYKRQITESNANIYYDQANKNNKISGWLFRAGGVILSTSVGLLIRRVKKNNNKRAYYRKICGGKECEEQKSKFLSLFKKKGTNK